MLFARFIGPTSSIDTQMCVMVTIVSWGLIAIVLAIVLASSQPQQKGPVPMTIADALFTTYQVLHKVGEDPAVQKALADAKAGHADYLEIAISIAKASYAAAGKPTPAQIVTAIQSVFHPTPVTP